MLIGYARTSTPDQLAGLCGQERDLAAAGADRVVSEHASAVKNRPGLNECLASLSSGDVLIVTKPDRLARSTADLLAMVDGLSARGVGLIVLSMGGERFDTRNPTAKLMLTILGGVATWEREIMLERQREGIAAARASGKYRGGRPSSLDAAEVRRLVEERGAIRAAKHLKVGKSTVYRIVSAGK
jgi:DNA invertase Pin-like site-specific DNA recombinase